MRKIIRYSTYVLFVGCLSSAPAANMCGIAHAGLGSDDLRSRSGAQAGFGKYGKSNNNNAFAALERYIRTLCAHVETVRVSARERLVQLLCACFAMQRRERCSTTNYENIEERFQRGFVQDGTKGSGESLDNGHDKYLEWLRLWQEQCEEEKRKQQEYTRINQRFLDGVEDRAKAEQQDGRAQAREEFYKNFLHAWQKRVMFSQEDDEK